jgi:hypothetical protein
MRTNVMMLRASNERIFEAAKSKPPEGLRGLSAEPVKKMTDILETFVDMLLRETTCD